MAQGDVMRGLSDAQFEVLAGHHFGIHQVDSTVAGIMFELEREGLLVPRVYATKTMFDRTRMGQLALRVETFCRLAETTTPR
jgi:hypothetical protein